MDSTLSREISPFELARVLEAGEHIQILDVRSPARVASGRIDLVPDQHYHNILGSKVLSYDSLIGTGIDHNASIVVVCGHGNDSRKVALHLHRLGHDARSLTGGMTAWMTVTLPRELGPPPSVDRLVQFDRLGKGALGYVLISNDEALIIDPPRNADTYLHLIKSAGARLTAVADTHVHADYISGAPALAQEWGIPYYLHPADAFFPYDGTPGKNAFQGIRDGDTLRVGRCSVRAMHTPGHTEGSLTYLVDDRVAFTGDFLFVASIGRPDLAGKTREWTIHLWKSMQAAKQQWNPHLVVYPAHYASDKERRADRSVAASLQQLLRYNESFHMTDEHAFRSWVESKAASFPEGYRTMKAINVGLISVSEAEADELESGKNECALGGA